MKKQLFKILSVVLILILILSAFAGCKDNKVKVNADGSYDIGKLTPVTAAVMKEENGRSVIYHNGSPYLYYGMHLRIDHLRSTTDEDVAKLNFDTYAKQIKEDGFDTIIAYIKWERIYDGEKYDFSDLEFQYSVAKKYDLKVHLNWFGYDVCGFGGYMSWQKDDLEKYPPLYGMNGAPILNDNNEYIPDLSQQIFLDEAYNSIQQVCAWLNVNDKDRRTVAIQLENEPNNGEGGNGRWLSQYKNIANHFDNLGKAVKEGPYSMITYLNVMNVPQGETFDGLTLKQTIQQLIDKEYIDIVGWNTYTAETSPRCKDIEYGNNLPVFTEMGICSYSVPGQINYCFSNGYGLGFYMFIDAPNPSSGTAFYRNNNAVAGIEKRDGTQIIPKSTLHSMGGKYELKHDEVTALNKSIKALRELISTQKISNIVVFNNSMKNKVNALKICNNEKITLMFNDQTVKYGPSGLCIGAQDGNFYAYSSQTSQFKFESAIKEVTSGTYSNGKWEEKEKIEVNDNTFTVEPGLAYRIVIN